MTEILNKPDTELLTDQARQIRELVLRAIHKVGTGHAGSSLSMIEILVALYFDILRHDPRRPDWSGRDILILSKGHGSPGLYATLAQAGYFDPEEMYTLRQFGSRLHGHPKAGALPGVELSTGSLGQGLSVALGMAMGLRRNGRPSQVACILGDGEIQEGQNWEALMAAAGLGVTNLIAILDRNGLQNDAPTEDLMPLGDMRAKAESFGWRVFEGDGHDFGFLRPALAQAWAENDKPSFVIANTVKGKGVSYMENAVKWHHHPIDDGELSQALQDIGG